MFNEATQASHLHNLRIAKILLIMFHAYATIPEPSWIDSKIRFMLNFWFLIGMLTERDEREASTRTDIDGLILA